ncbi:MAG: acetolactate synthase large subunit [Chloroflexi bacterium]|nr:acetolactate synthase large subunit [Chloroflexota bacterium]
MRAAELLVKCLENEGVRYVFGVPGEEILEIIDSLRNSSIRFIVTRHEQGAAFMANAYGRLTGQAGVCLATLGPGATNLTTGIADATLDFAPLVAITGQTSLDRVHKESHQFVDVVSIFEKITKWNTRAARPEVIPEVVRKAFKLAQQEKPGACHIELTMDVQRMQATEDAAPLPSRRIRRASPDKLALERAAALISEAKAPLVLAGSSAVRRPDAAMELRRFAKRFNIPVTHTFMGKGAMPDYDPLSLMPLGMPGGNDLCASGVGHADLVIAVGYDQVEYHPERWNAGRSKRIVHIDYTPSEVDRFYRPEVEVVADIRETLELLGNLLRYNISEDELGCTQALSAAAIAERNDSASGTSFPMKPQEIIRDLRQALGEEDILVSDVGAHKVWIARYYPAYLPGTVLISNGYAAMGFALPSAIAAKLVFPGRRVVAAVGDGGFLMSVMELETAVRLGLPIVVVVWVDGGYGLIKWKQEAEKRAVFGVDFGNPDWVRLAESFGAKGYQVEQAGDFPRMLEKALASAQSSVIAVPVDSEENLKLTQRLAEMPCPVAARCQIRHNAAKV